MKLGNLLRCMYKKIVAGLLMFFVVIGLENYLHVSKLMVLICQVVIGIATYLIALMIEKDEWMLIELRRGVLYFKNKKGRS